MTQVEAAHITNLYQTCIINHQLDTPNPTNILAEQLLVISQKGNIIFICFLGKEIYFLSGGQTIDYKLKMSFNR